MTLINFRRTLATLEKTKRPETFYKTILRSFGYGMHRKLRIFPSPHRTRPSTRPIGRGLRRAIVAGNFEYEAKLYNRVKDLEIEVPATDSKQPDLERQISIAKTQKHLEAVSQRVTEVGKYANKARLK
ncbi:MAG: hypothetical protein PHY43_04915 [Verrucomicrobiales bacterium]|nr:hypothetical protein [Verrucomicrobiales bacterium]